MAAKTSSGWRSAITIATVVCSAMPLSVATLHAAERPAVKRVLILHHYGHDAPFRALFDLSLERTLRATEGSAFEIYSESLESYRFPSDAHVRLMRDYMREKYRGRTPDLIVAIWDPSLEFLRTFRDELFPNVPIVALLSRPPEPGRDPDLTAVWAGSGIRANCDLVRRLHPEAREIIIVDGAFRSAGRVQSQVLAELKDFDPATKITYLQDRSLDDVLTTVAAASEDSVVVYARQTMATPTESLDQMEGLTRIVRVSPVPVYVVLDPFIGRGVVGGIVWRAEENGALIAGIVQRVAAGVRAGDIPSTPLPATPTFDARELQRWAIDESRLPAGSLVLFRKPTFWGQYRRYALGAAAVFVAQVALIGGLLVNRTRRRRAEKALRHSEARQAAMLNAQPDLMFVMSNDGVFLDYHARDPALLYAPADRFLGKCITDIMPPPLATVFMRELAEARRSPEPRLVEYALPIDDAVRHFETRLVPCESDTVLSVVRDITVRKRTELELSERELELRVINARNRDLAGRLIASQEAERQRIARELHDDLSQKLALLSIEIDEVGGNDPAIRAGIDAQLRAISARSTEIASDVHRLSHELHPAKLQVLGLVAAIDAVCRDTSRQHLVVVEFTHGDVPRLVGPEPSLCLYRITQEALYNVVRHSGASRALVCLGREQDELHLQIVDSGTGFVRRDDELAGLGLVSMRERVAFLGGTIAIQSSPGEGTRIDVRVPLHVAASAPVLQPAETG